MTNPVDFARAGPQTFPEAIARHAVTCPTHVFLRDGESSLTYRETHEAIERLAAVFASHGIGSEQRCVILMENGLDYALAWLALARLGAISVLINQAHLGDILEHQLRLAAPDAFVLDEVQAGKLAALPDQSQIEGATVFHGTSAAPAAAPYPMGARVVDLWRAPGDPAALAPIERPALSAIQSIFYTSGTTGPSKAVAYTHTQSWQTAWTVAEHLDATDVFYMTNPMCHVSLPHCLGAALLAGGTLAVRAKFSASSFWSDVRAYGATVTMMLGSVANFVASRPVAPDDRKHPLRKVLMVPLLEDVSDFCARFGVTVMSWFNMTELSVPLHTGGFSHMAEPLPLRPRAGAMVRIVDADDRPLAPGTPGELVVRHDTPWQISRGYWRNAEATVDAWRNQWFHTGDLFVENPPGHYRFLDRMKDCIRRRGENIASFEVEQQILCHAAVEEAAVVGVASADGEQEVLAVVVLKADASLAPEELLDFLGDRLPHFCVPRYVTPRREPLPKTPTGKVIKTELRETAVREAWDREQHGYRRRR
ncbi:MULTISPECIES: AMP-binding protein [unclassified Xanthobacter]|uniref:AMP-binding protein n=1 Tax=unclassified Xanthobacter TaxID=2623496 RepID=UPI001EE13571|nr:MULTISPECIES: AMP-binding protein [unclassified Xanthobacter]